MHRGQLRMKNCLENKWQKKLDIMHMERIVNMKSRIDMTNPFCLKRNSRKGKKEQMIEGYLCI